MERFCLCQNKLIDMIMSHNKYKVTPNISKLEILYPFLNQKLKTSHLVTLPSYLMCRYKGNSYGYDSKNVEVSIHLMCRFKKDGCIY